jgi:hypothetical protein
MLTDGPTEPAMREPAPLRCECWQRAEGDGVTVTHLFGVALLIIPRVIDLTPPTDFRA